MRKEALSLDPGLRGWQPESESAALAWFAVDLDRTAGVIDDGLDQMQAEPDASVATRRGRVHLVKAVEDSDQVLCGDADTIVLDPHEHLTSLQASPKSTP